MIQVPIQSEHEALEFNSFIHISEIEPNFPVLRESTLTTEPLGSIVLEGGQAEYLYILQLFCTTERQKKILTLLPAV